jgi:hypothetical protein
MTDIQYFAAHYVAFKENLTENDKGFLIKWIKENSDDKIKSLLITGDYKYQQEAVGQFDRAFPILNEVAAYTIPGITNARGSNLTGKYVANIDIDRVVDFINNRTNDMFHKGSASGWQYGHAKGLSRGLAGAAAAALIITVAYKMYKRFLSKAAKACKGKSGATKTSCMNKYKKQATQQRINALQKGMTACGKTKDPGKCKITITKKIRNLKAQLGEL